MVAFPSLLLGGCLASWRAELEGCGCVFRAGKDPGHIACGHRTRTVRFPSPTGPLSSADRGSEKWKGGAVGALGYLRPKRWERGWKTEWGAEQTAQARSVLGSPDRTLLQGSVSTSLRQVQASGRDWSHCLVSRREQPVLEAQLGARGGGEILGKVAPRSLAQSVSGAEARPGSVQLVLPNYPRS